MNNGVMADGDIIAEDSLRTLISTMDYGSILHIHLIAHSDAIYIASHYSIEPKAAIVASYHISHNGSIGSNKAVLAKRRILIVDRKYYRHSDFFM
jgi:hypothetical protein